MKGRSSLRLPWVGLCCLALVAAATLPAWATAPQEVPQLPPPAPVVIYKTAPPSPPQKAVPVRKVVRPKEDVVVHYQASPKVPSPRWSPIVKTPSGTYTVFLRDPNLPADGKELIEKYAADQKAIQEEADQKLEAARASAVKALEALQETYTKEGKLDEAVAIRDYLRSGGPGNGPSRYTYSIKRQP